MPYTVVWLRGPQAALASMWVNGPDRQAMSVAANELDHRLRLNPIGAGTISGSVYRLHLPPLEAVYTVSSLDRQVVVTAINRLP
jgi:hypothetical protein